MMSDPECTRTENVARARLLFEPEEMHYHFAASHPMQPQRLQALLELLEAADLWHLNYGPTRLRGRPATQDELLLFHTLDYITSVQYLSTPGRRGKQQDWIQRAQRYGLNEGDTPAFPGMHETFAHITGGTLVSLSAVMGLPEGGTFDETSRRPLHVFHPAGGWHHALTNRAAGFCVYNDVAVAIAYLLQSCEAKVAYINFDAHHSDGVQQAFYDDPRVLTISLHETGRTLFPGTGDILEQGKGSGRGSAINIPLEPFTDDDSYKEVMEMVLEPFIASFAPDVLVSMHGCDTHAWDPLSHLHLSMCGIQAQASLTHRLAHRYCSGRWVAVGGGGYDLYRVVPRAWASLWAEMAECSLPDELPYSWRERWQSIWQQTRFEQERLSQVVGKEGGWKHFPTTFQDHKEDIIISPHRESIHRQNKETAMYVRQLFLSPLVRQAFVDPRPLSPFCDLFDRFHKDRDENPSRKQTLKTERGSILLRDFCPPSLVERLHVDSGMHAFARMPEYEHQLLLSIARQTDCALALAHTPAGEIIGQVTIAPLDAWWGGLACAYEVAIEVSSHWRNLGIAHRLLAFALESEAKEELLLFAIGLSWHWDTEKMSISSHQYRQMLIRLFASQGFQEYKTTEPDVAMTPANVLLVRVGKRVNVQDKERFLRSVKNSRLKPGSLPLTRKG